MKFNYVSGKRVDNGETVSGNFVRPHYIVSYLNQHELLETEIAEVELSSITMIDNEISPFCSACKEEHCLVSLDDTCAMIRRYNENI